MGLDAWLGLSSLVLSVGVLVFNAGWQSAQSAAFKAEIARLEVEIERLRAWHHKVGDNPNDAMVELFKMHTERIARLETKVFNGVKI